jgi:glutathione S-transferase
MASSTIKITYFPIQGAAEAARLALVIGGIKFEDERVPPEVWRGEGGAAIKAKSPYGQVDFSSR